MTGNLPAVEATHINVLLVARGARGFAIDAGRKIDRLIERLLREGLDSAVRDRDAAEVVCPLPWQRAIVGVPIDRRDEVDRALLFTHRGLAELKRLRRADIDRRQRLLRESAAEKTKPPARMVEA